MHVRMRMAETNAGREAVRGFTLIELLVVLVIIGIISMVVLASQSSFNKTIILANTAYDIALTLRSTQTYGLSSRVSLLGQNAGYGIHLQSGTKGSFILFADTNPVPTIGNCHGVPAGGTSAPDAKPGDCVYQASYGTGQTETKQTYTLGNGMTVSDFCVYSMFGTWSCTANGLNSLDIVFARPNPDAFISASGLYASSLTKACLIVSSPQGGSRYVVVSAAGQIAVNSTGCL